MVWEMRKNIYDCVDEKHGKFKVGSFKTFDEAIHDSFLQ